MKWNYEGKLPVMEPLTAKILQWALYAQMLNTGYETCYDAGPPINLD